MNSIVIGTKNSRTRIVVQRKAIAPRWWLTFVSLLAMVPPALLGITHVPIVPEALAFALQVFLWRFVGCNRAVAGMTAGALTICGAALWRAPWSSEYALWLVGVGAALCYGVYRSARAAEPRVYALRRVFERRCAKRH